MGLNLGYHLVMTNIAMENPNHKWRFIAGKIIYKWAIYTMAMLNNQRVMGLKMGYTIYHHIPIKYETKHNGSLVERCGVYPEIDRALTLKFSRIPSSREHRLTGSDRIGVWEFGAVPH